MTKKAKTQVTNWTIDGSMSSKDEEAVKDGSRLRYAFRHSLQWMFQTFSLFTIFFPLIVENLISGLTEDVEVPPPCPCIHNLAFFLCHLSRRGVPPLLFKASFHDALVSTRDLEPILGSILLPHSFCPSSPHWCAYPHVAF